MEGHFDLFLCVVAASAGCSRYEYLVHEGEPDAARYPNGRGQRAVPKFCTIVTDDEWSGKLLPPYALHALNCVIFA